MSNLQFEHLDSTPSVASALNIAALNVGIAIGSIIGGLVINSIGIVHTPWVGGIMVIGTVLSYSSVLTS